MARKPATQRWVKMGVELEGAWDKHPEDMAKTVSGAQYHSDGSVRQLSGHMGEIVTRPHALAKNLLEDVKALYPQRINDTCGLHVHASFSPMDTAILMRKDFWEFYQERWRAWGKEHQGDMGDMKSVFWSRLDGRWTRRDRDGRNYCEAVFKPEKQMAEPHTADHRYTQVNFSAWHKYKTVESRLLPMFHSVDLAVNGVEYTGAIYDDFLSENDFPKVSIYKEWQAVGDCVIDTTELKMPDYSPWEYKKELPHHGIITGPDVEYSIDGANDLMFPWVREVPGNHA